MQRYQNVGNQGGPSNIIRPVLEYCPVVWSGAAACHLERLGKVQKRALPLIGEGTIIDSLALRRTVSALCLLYKLLSDPRQPCIMLQPLFFFFFFCLLQNKNSIT